MSAAARARRVGPGAVRTTANALTAARLVLAAPTLVLIARDGAGWTAAGMWAALTLTDGLDGWLARREGTTRSGAFLDPLADKVLTLGGMGALVWHGVLWWLPVAIVAAREVAVSVFRAGRARQGISVPARTLGKWKTVTQMLAVGAFVFPPTAGARSLQLALVWAAVALTLVSGLDLWWRGRSGPAGGAR